MDTFLEPLLKELQKLSENRELSEAEVQEISTEYIEKATQKISEDLQATSREHVGRRRDDEIAFQRQLRDRWRPAFDLLDMILIVSQEAGSVFNSEHRPQAAKTKDHTFEALVNLHARSVLVAREAAALLHCGLPDGALGRWRSLHEIATIMAFLKRMDRDTALKYLVDHEFQARKAVRLFDKYGDRADLNPFDPDAIREIEETCAKWEQTFGCKASSDYWWASAGLGRKRPTFRDIEEYTGLDHWRPRYHWSSTRVHGTHQPPGTLLGTIEAEESSLLVGPSENGLSDPFQMVALSLAVATTSLLTHVTELKWLGVAQAIDDMAVELNELAFELSQKLEHDKPTPSADS